MDFRDIKEFLKDSFKYILIILGVFLLFFYVISMEQIVGPSMNPTLKDNNIVFLNKIVYRFKEPKRNEIIVLKNDSKHMIKRVIGLPGEKIEYKDNFLYINDEKYIEPFLERDEVFTKDFSLKDMGYEKIPEDKYLVLGDNREDSKDSRQIGLISKKDIIGRVSLRVWPLNKIGFVK